MRRCFMVRWFFQYRLTRAVTSMGCLSALRTAYHHASWGGVMAKDKMVTSVEVRFAWWVKPYLRLVTLFILSVEPFLDVEDERLDQFLQRQGDFVARYGLKLSVDGKPL